MQPATLDLIEAQNADFLREFQKKESGVPVDITGSTFQMQLRACETDTSVIADWSTTNGKIVIVDAVNGVFRFNVTAVELLTILADVYFQDLRETTSGGIELVLFKGQYDLSQSVTR